MGEANSTEKMTEGSLHANMKYSFMQGGFQTARNLKTIIMKKYPQENVPLGFVINLMESVEKECMMNMLLMTHGNGQVH